MTVESPASLLTLRAALKSRGLGWALAAALVAALAAGPLILIVFAIQEALTESFSNKIFDVGWIDLLSGGFGILVIAALFGLPISLPAALLNALMQNRLVRYGRTAWVWAPLSGAIGGAIAGFIGGFFLHSFNYGSFLLTKLIADGSKVALFLLVSAAMGMLHRCLAFRREIVKIDLGMF